MPIEDGPRVRQAGAVAFREQHQIIEALLVRPSNGQAEWLLPKGHIEPHEPEWMTAVREAREEAGVRGRLIGAVDGISSFVSKNEPVDVRYYVMECVGEVQPAEAREHTWLPLTLATEALTHDDDRRILCEAFPLIDSHLRASGRGDSLFRDYLMQELQHTTESLLKSEEDGERRVTFFLTVSGGAGALLAFVLGANNGYQTQVVSWQVVWVLLALLVFGYFVLIRVVTRNRTSDLYKQKLHRIRKWFTPNVHDPRRAWVAFDPFQLHTKRQLSYWGPNTGGWLEILILVNAIIAGALTAAIVPTDSWRAEGMVAAMGGFVAWIVLVARTKHLIQRAIGDVRMHEK